VAEYFEDPRKARWRNIGLAAVFLMVAFFLYLLPQTQQEPIRRAIRGSVLMPFIWAQTELGSQTARSTSLRQLRVERDSLLAVVAAQANLGEENSRLRELLGLRNRAPGSFVPAELVRVGTPGAESSFLLDVGTEDGVASGSFVIAAGGLLGIVWEPGSTTSHAIDWSHPDFRVSAMTPDGQAYGIVESSRGRARELDHLILVGAPFHSEVAEGTRVVTSGRGGLYPRGIVVGTVVQVVEVEDEDIGWRKSYVVRPAVRPESATLVLVATARDDDVAALWGEIPAEGRMSPGDDGP
jgi:rod shape-determining protein MreC